MNPKTLDDLSATYRMDSPQDKLMRELVVRTFEPFLHPNATGLELGCSDGYMTQILAQKLRSLDVVEGAESFIEKAKNRTITNANFHHMLFEDFKPTQKYDVIFASYILTHIENTEALFARIKTAMHKDSLLFVVVPNSRVLSRQLAMHMGLISDLKTLTENDKNHGHVRAYDRVSLNRELEDAGFESVAQGGIMLKPLADFQMDELMRNGMIAQPQIEGLYKLGLEHPDLCSALYNVCALRQ